tara:strand:- start:5166 stop:5552 length:387 start_codon:yes stop_codon:yes gene_type:complete
VRSFPTESSRAVATDSNANGNLNAARVSSTFSIDKPAMWHIYLLLFCIQVFLLLVTEMAIFLALIIPLPFTWRRKLFTFISESPIIAKLQYGMKITFIFILILFVDSVNRVYRVQVELSGMGNNQGGK